MADRRKAPTRKTEGKGKEKKVMTKPRKQMETATAMERREGE
jgi:hypothetical protein